MEGQLLIIHLMTSMRVCIESRGTGDISSSINEIADLAVKWVYHSVSLFTYIYKTSCNAVVLLGQIFINVELKRS